MQAQKLTDILTKQLALNESLLVIAARKTEVIKAGDITALDEVLKGEQTHIAAINQLEQERKRETAYLLSGHPISGQEPALSDLLAILPSSEQVQLAKLQKELVASIQQLKERNELNQQLLYQSMQFISLTLDLMQPERKHFNYEKPQKQTYTNKSRSMFDSKA